MKTNLQFDILTLFPKMFEGPLTESLLGRAEKSGLIKIAVHDLRKWSDDSRHKKVDDRPYGGGAGMVIRPEPVYRALKSLGAIVGRSKKKKPFVVFLSPQGVVLSQTLSETLAGHRRLILLCGHYEGIDERIMEWVDLEVSLGDFVLTGGEIPALAVVDAVSRLVPGVVGDPESIQNESFSSGILDFPHYTRPSEWRGKKVPPVLLSGNHREIDHWRKNAAIHRTKVKRPDLLKLKRHS